MESSSHASQSEISENVDFILSHFQEPPFPRKIMTKRLGYQKEVFSKQEALKYFESSDYEDCRINAYPSFTNYHGINRVAPSFVMIDLDLRDFGSVKVKLDRALNKILRRISVVAHGHPTVLWTGNGYHIYQPMDGFILEEDRFARLKEPGGKDLTSEFMQFAEEFLTNKKGDPQHNPSVNSCLVRIPRTINSKCEQEVKLIQRWDGHRPAIQYLLRDFRIWLINRRLEQSRSANSAHSHITNSTKIRWIEKLLQTPLIDYRKFVIWRILIPYLINIRKCSTDEASNIINDWLDSCRRLRQLDFNPNYTIKHNINSTKSRGYLPISLDNLKIENRHLHDVVMD